MPCTGTPPPRQRQGDAAGADAELERGASAGELREDIDDRLDRGRFRHVADQLVVARRDTLAEVVLGPRANSTSCE